MIVYGSSSLGKCMKQQVALRMDYSPAKTPEWLQKAFDGGHKYEEVLISRLLEAGRNIDFVTPVKDCVGRWDHCTQHEVVFKVSGEVIVLAHLDGIERIDDDNSPTIEIKSMSKLEYAKHPHNHNIWDSPGLIQDYKWQISAAMVARKQPTIVFFGCRDSDEWFEVTVEKPFHTEAEIRGRIMQIEGWARQGVLPDTCDNKGNYCSVAYVTGCQGVTEWGDEEFAALGKTYKRQVAAKKKAEEVEKATRSLLLSAARGDSDDEFVEKKVQTDDVSVSFYKGRSKPGTDWNKLVEDTGVDIKEYQTPGSEYQAIRVTLKKEKNNED
jgi:hypothetical protein